MCLALDFDVKNGPEVPQFVIPASGRENSNTYSDGAFFTNTLRRVFYEHIEDQNHNVFAVSI